MVLYTPSGISLSLFGVGNFLTNWTSLAIAAARCLAAALSFDPKHIFCTICWIF
jgi:uncharacterized protein YejL (UPF0352 family)